MTDEVEKKRNRSVYIGRRITTASKKPMHCFCEVNEDGTIDDTLTFYPKAKASRQLRATKGLQRSLSPYRGWRCRPCGQAYRATHHRTYSGFHCGRHLKIITDGC